MASLASSRVPNVSSKNVSSSMPIRRESVMLPPGALGGTGGSESICEGGRGEAAGVRRRGGEKSASHGGGALAS